MNCHNCDGFGFYISKKLPVVIHICVPCSKKLKEDSDLWVMRSKMKKRMMYESGESFMNNEDKIDWDNKNLDPWNNSQDFKNKLDSSES